eukprot:TRINITY_DN5676_c0_g1_i2.p1 TRINITY_DN5676_c0_g1~~TRINITY_DN5676_c0_g1_i2.p1  ORF type:complete len:143 (+),score=24.67 TRINITY_DN5676_c0_g1_i2:91-519(+)
MVAWVGYLYFLGEALEKLSPVSTTVYRGVLIHTQTERENIAKQYSVGRLVSWSGFTSSSKEFDVASDFAGPQGIVFEMQVVSGRSLDKLTYLGGENEVLLGVNSRYVVVHGLQLQQSPARRPVWTIQLHEVLLSTSHKPFRF